MYAWLALFNATRQLASSIIESAPVLGDSVRRGEPLTYEQLEEIVNDIRRSPPRWEIIQKVSQNMLKNPPDWLDQELKGLPPKLARKVRRKTLEV